MHLRSAPFTLLACLLGATPSVAQSQIFSIDPQDDAEFFGSSVCLAPDLDGDGVADFLVSDHLDDGAAVDAGAVSVFSGSSGLRLAKINGARAGDWFGFSVAILDDLTGDGAAEFAVGAPAIFTEGGVVNSERGYVRIYNGANGQLIRHINASGECEEFGFAVASLADLDGDGLGDLGVGAPGEGIGGRAYVFSTATGQVLWSAPNGAEDARFGSSFAAVGDVNFDGTEDFGIGAPGQPGHGPNSGAVFFISGAQLSLLKILESSGPNEFFGRSIQSVGDLNLDGVDDLLVGSPFGDDLFGTTLPQGPGLVRAYSGTNGEELFDLEGGAVGELFGWSLAQAGDANGDGAADFAVGSPRAGISGDSGRVAVYSGLDQSLLFSVDGSPAEGLGRSIDGGLDLNLDETPDLVAGAGGSGFLAPARVLSTVPLGLVATPHFVSASQGGSIQLEIDAGPDFGGLAYYVLGSMGGTAPGIDFDGFHIPLNWDQYFCETLIYPNTGPFQWNLGSLNPQGKGLAPSALNWGPGLGVFTGVQAHHVLVVWHPVFGTINYVSAVTSMTFVP